MCWSCTWWSLRPDSHLGGRKTLRWQNDNALSGLTHLYSLLLNMLHSANGACCIEGLTMMELRLLIQKASQVTIQTLAKSKITSLVVTISTKRQTRSDFQTKREHPLKHLLIKSPSEKIILTISRKLYEIALKMNCKVCTTLSQYSDAS